MMELIVFLIREHYVGRVRDMHLETFEDDVHESVRELAEIQLEESITSDVLHEGHDLFRLMMPCRTSIVAAPQLDAPLIIANLQSLPQLLQRTAEWYAFRHTLITASAIHKAHGTPAKRNELIVEKCDPTITIQSLSMEGARHWGVKYEAVSVLYYTAEYNTTIHEFGCIRHPSIEFLGASPDGINVGENRYGRMLEIKNPVSREITCVPKEEYWIQVQVQMAVCRLKSCDFLETKFVEYASRSAFDLDGTFQRSATDQHKGIILCVAVDGNSKYLYPPYQCSEQDYEEWEALQLSKTEWISTIYWKLDDVLCTLIEYSDEWFQASLPIYQELWETIQRERENGEWISRRPKKRS